MEPTPRFSSQRLVWTLAPLALLCAAGLWLTRTGPAGTPGRLAAGGTPPARAGRLAPETAVPSRRSVASTPSSEVRGAVLTARLLGRLGAPYTRARVRLLIGGIAFRTATDAAGILRLAVPWQSLDRTPGEPVRLQVTAAGQGPAPRAERTFPWPQPGATTDLGDIILQWAPLLAAGIAMDPAGRALPGLSWLVVTDDEKRATVSHWLEEDGAGHFALHGSTAAQDLLLWAQGADQELRTWPPVAVARGAEGVAVTLAPVRSIEALVLLPAGTAVDAVDIAMPTLTRVQVPPTLSPGWLPIIEHQALANGWGKVTVRLLPPGRHDLVFYLHGEERCSLPGVSVPAYLPVADPRLRAVDLR